MSAPDTSPTHALARMLMGQAIEISPAAAAALCDTALQHGVYPQLSAAVYAGRAKGLTEQQRTRLQHESMALAALDMAQAARLRPLIQLLHERNVSILLLKGVAMAQLHYVPASHRHRTDADLYIRVHDRARVHETLNELGYTLLDTGGADPTVNQLHAVHSADAHCAVHLDIHWAISNRTLFRDKLPFELAWAQSQDVVSLGPHAKALSNAMLLVHACFHRLAHARNRQSNRLFWLNDIRLLLQRMDARELAAFVDMALEQGVGVVCAAGVEACINTFGLEQQPALLKALGENRASEPSARMVKAGSLRWAASDVLALRGVSRQWQYLLRLLGNQLGRGA